MKNDSVTTLEDLFLNLTEKGISMFPYLKVLIRQRIAAWNPFTYRRPGQSKGEAALGVRRLYAGSALMLYGMLVMVEYFLYGAFSQMGAQTILALTRASCARFDGDHPGFFYVLNELFFSKDVAYVSSLPISSRGLLAAKGPNAQHIWLGEVGIALLVCLPVVILYGAEHAMGVFVLRKGAAADPLPVDGTAGGSGRAFLPADPHLRAVEAARSADHRDEHGVPDRFHVF